MSFSVILNLSPYQIVASRIEESRLSTHRENRRLTPTLSYAAAGILPRAVARDSEQSVATP